MIQVTSWTLGKTGELGHMIRFPVRVTALISCRSIAGTANTNVEENFLQLINFVRFGLMDQKIQRSARMTQIAEPAELWTQYLKRKVSSSLHVLRPSQAPYSVIAKSLFN